MFRASSVRAGGDASAAAGHSEENDGALAERAVADGGIRLSHRVGVAGRSGAL